MEKKNPLNLAAIDIGSNGARLLIKRFEETGGERRVSKVSYLRVPLRLGKDVFTLGKVSQERERMMLHMMKAYRQLMKLYDVQDYRACATSAMRDAENGHKVMKKIKEKTGIRLEIISGEEEARLLAGNLFPYMHEGNCSDEQLPQMTEGAAYAYVDVGGGSTEVSLLCDGRLVESHSYNCGTLRMLSGQVKAETLRLLREDLARYAERFSAIRVIGSGGNINKLYKLARLKGSRREMPVETIRTLHDQLQPMSLEERMAHFSLKDDRADVIVPAAEIYLLVAESLGADTILVPNISLADSIVDSLARAKC